MSEHDSECEMYERHCGCESRQKLRIQIAELVDVLKDAQSAIATCGKDYDYVMGRITAAPKPTEDV